MAGAGLSKAGAVQLLPFLPPDRVGARGLPGPAGPKGDPGSRGPMGMRGPPGECPQHCPFQQCPLAGGPGLGACLPHPDVAEVAWASSDHPSPDLPLLQRCPPAPTNAWAPCNLLLLSLGPSTCSPIPSLKPDAWGWVGPDPALPGFPGEGGQGGWAWAEEEQQCPPPRGQGSCGGRGWHGSPREGSPDPARVGWGMGRASQFERPLR